MALEDNHNHFCIYCGAKLVAGQNFCTECGKEVYHEQIMPEVILSKYDDEIKQIEMEYNSKQNKAKQLVEKLFDPTNIAYDNFMAAINKSNQLFENQLEITKKMVELDTDNNELMETEIENKITTLKAFIDKIEDLINEMVIHLSSNKKDNEDITNLFEDMDDLIHSVKDY